METCEKLVRMDFESDTKEHVFVFDHATPFIFFVGSRDFFYINNKLRKEEIIASCFYHKYLWVETNNLIEMIDLKQQSSSIIEKKTGTKIVFNFFDTNVRVCF